MNALFGSIQIRKKYGKGREVRCVYEFLSFGIKEIEMKILKSVWGSYKKIPRLNAKKFGSYASSLVNFTQCCLHSLPLIAASLSHVSRIYGESRHGLLAWAHMNSKDHAICSQAYNWLIKEKKNRLGTKGWLFLWRDHIINYTINVLWLIIYGAA